MLGRELGLQLLTHLLEYSSASEERAAQPASEPRGEPADQEATERLLDADSRLLWHPYTNAVAPSRCLAVRSASGVRLQLEDGRQLIDGM